MMFNELYEDFCTKGYKATKDYDDKYIDRAITLHQGDSIPGFPSIDAFLYLINPQLEKLRDPALECLNNAFVYLESLANQIIKKLFVRFPAMLEEITEITSHVLQDQREKARNVVENIIDAELGYLFTNDVDYLLNKTNIIP